MIKPFFLDLSSQEIVDIQSKVGEILKSGQLILGKYTEKFEQEFAKYIGSEYAVSLNSGTSALEVLLMLHNAQGKAIAVQTNTNFASVAAIIKSGGTPIFMDMDKNYFCPSLEILRKTVDKNPHIKGVVWVHIGGIITPDFIKVVEYCKNRSIFLIEDCAHAHGSQYKGTKAGNFANGGAFSFFPTKVMTTMEGGMVTTNDFNIASSIKSYRNQGKRDGEYGGLHYDLGNSWRMNEISAYIGIIQLSKLDEMIIRRQNATDKIIQTLNDFNINYCDTSHMDKASNYKFIIRLDANCDINFIKEEFKNNGIILGGGVYDVPCHLHPVFKNITVKDVLPNSEEYCPNHICLPITSGTTPDDIIQMIDSIKSIIIN
ncbi:MAG: DegT/DnrJ/EryC1/StrS family aminotransferase [Bacteroidales bacterium]